MTSKKHKPKVQTMRSFAAGSGILKMEKVGVSRFDWTDPYHMALTVSWPQFLLGLLGVYLLINLCFATLYWLAPGSVSNLAPGSLADAFFFSLETLATVGYGYMAPVTRYAHIVSAIEICVGLGLTATMTGLVFVRFSKPRSKILFASHIVVTRSHGVPRLMIRIGNGRLSAMYEASMRVTTLTTQIAPNGERFRSLVDLKLQRSDMPFFPLTWTAIHDITEDSPLAALRTMSQEELANTSTRVMVSVVARDPSLGAQVYALHAYGASNIALDMRYAQAIMGVSEDHSVADMRKLSDIEPEQTSPQPQ